MLQYSPKVEWVLEMYLIDFFEDGKSADKCGTAAPFCGSIEQWWESMADLQKDDTAEAHHWCEGNTRVKCSSTTIGMKIWHH